jgi:hypothetical protein
MGSHHKSHRSRLQRNAHQHQLCCEYRIIKACARLTNERVVEEVDYTLDVGVLVGGE